MSATILLMLALLSQGIPFGTGSQRNAAGKTTLATDNFTQSDETPLSSSGKWNLDANDCQLKVVSHTVGPATASAACYEYYTGGVSWPAGQWVQATVSSLTSCGCDPGLAVRGNGSTTYDAIFWDQGSGDVFVKECIANSCNNIYSVSEAFSNSDVLYASVQGTAIKIAKNGTVFSGSITSGIASGDPGMWVVGTDGVGYLSAWSAGACNGAC